MSLLRYSINKLQRDGIIEFILTPISNPQSIALRSELAHYLAQRYMTFRNTVTVNDVRIDTGSGAVQTSSLQLLLGEHEKEIVTFVNKYLPQDTNIVELGGGIGFVSTHVQRHINHRQTQIVVEPNPSALFALKQTRELNQGNYQIFERAYHPTGNHVELSTDGDYTQASTTRELTDSTSVKSISLQSLRNKTGLGEFSLIVDIEGAEAQLINEELNLILEYCPYIIIEYHTFNDIRKEVENARKKLEKSQLQLVDERGSGLKKAIYKNPTLI